MKKYMCALSLLIGFNAFATSGTASRCDSKSTAEVFSKIPLADSYGIYLNYSDESNQVSSLSSLQNYPISKDEKVMILKQLGINDPIIKINKVVADNNGQFLAISKTSQCGINILPAIEMTQEMTNVVWAVTEIKAESNSYSLVLTEKNTNRKVNMLIKLN